MNKEGETGQKIIEIPASKMAYHEEIKHKKLRACAYCRVSSSSTEQLHSFEAQYGYYSSYIQKNDNWIFAGIYADEGITGSSSLKRKRFQDMLDDCEEGKIDLIITKSITRFARNVVDCISTARRLRSMGIAVYFEKERLNTLVMENERILTIWGAVAQEEAISTSKNAHWSCVRRFENGTFVLARAPYGYRKDEQKELVIYGPEAEIIRDMAVWFLNGAGCDFIALKLDELGIPSPRGAKWSASTVRRILRNEKMIGDYLMQKRVTNGMVPFRQIPNRGQVRQYYIEDDHQGILSKEDRRKIDLIMKSRQGNPNNISRDFLLNGSDIVCGKCGSRLSREYAKTIRGDNKVVWRCITHHKNRRACNLKPVKDSDLNFAVQVLRKKMLCSQESIIQPLIHQLESIKRRRNTEGRLYEIGMELTEVKMRRHVLQRMRAEGYMDPSFFVSQAQELDQEQMVLQDEKIQLQKKSFGLKQIEDLHILTSYLELGADLNQDVEKEVLGELIKAIWVLEQRVFQFDMKCGLELMVDLDEGLDGTAISDSFGIQTF